MQLITFKTKTTHMYIGQAKRLRCNVFTDSNGGLAITGEKDAIFKIVERLIEDRITFSQFVSLEGRIAAEFWDASKYANPERHADDSVDEHLKRGTNPMKLLLSILLTTVMIIGCSSKRTLYVTEHYGHFDAETSDGLRLCEFASREAVASWAKSQGYEVQPQEGSK